MPDDAEDFWQRSPVRTHRGSRAPISVSSRSVTPSTTGSVRPARTSMRGSPNWARPGSSTASTAMSITRDRPTTGSPRRCPRSPPPVPRPLSRNPRSRSPRLSPPSPNPQLPSPLLSRSPRLLSPHRRSPAASPPGAERTLSGDDHHQLGALRCHPPRRCGTSRSRSAIAVSPTNQATASASPPSTTRSSSI